MKPMNKAGYISAIIPAKNERSTIANILRTLVQSKECNEIIVVDDGSVDETGWIARRIRGVRVLRHKETRGKAEALKTGVQEAKGDILLFLDADLLGLRVRHVRSLLAPVQKNGCDMCVGIQDWGEIIFKIQKQVPQISGQRVLRRSIFEKAPEKLVKGFQIEEVLNEVCRMNDLKVQTIQLRGVRHRSQPKKYGLIQGTLGYFRMLGQVIKAIILVRWYRIFG